MDKPLDGKAFYHRVTIRYDTEKRRNYERTQSDLLPSPDLEKHVAVTLPVTIKCINNSDKGVFSIVGADVKLIEYGVDSVVIG